MRSLIKLFVYLVFVAGSMMIVSRIASSISTYQKIIERSQEMGIDNASLFYSEEGWTSRAEQHLNRKLKQRTKP